MMSTTYSVGLETLLERERQDERWGEQNHPDGTGNEFDPLLAMEAKRICEVKAEAGTVTWRDILTEEVCEAYAESDPVRLREELIQVAAVAQAWVEAIDRRTT